MRCRIKPRESGDSGQCTGGGDWGPVRGGGGSSNQRALQGTGYRCHFNRRDCFAATLETANCSTLLSFVLGLARPSCLGNYMNIDKTVQ